MTCKKIFYSSILESLWKQLGKISRQKKILAALILCCSSLYVSAGGNISSDCTYKGIPLYGRVKIVDFMPDFRVQQVDFMPDLRVKKALIPSSCGEWQFVDTVPDFTIQFVDFVPDFTIQYVDFMPGMSY